MHGNDALSKGFIDMWVHCFEDPVEALMPLSRSRADFARAELIRVWAELMLPEKAKTAFTLIYAKKTNLRFLPQKLIYNICKY